MRRASTMLVTMGLGLALCLYGCGGSKPAETADEGETAPVEQTESEPEDEEASEVEEAPQELTKAELKVAGSNYHYELKEAGTFEGAKNSLSFQQDGAIGFNDAGKAQLLGVDGAPLLDGAEIRGIDYWAKGLYVVALDTDEVNNTGLVSLTDGVVVPLEAAALSYATEKPEDARFVEVVYATEETDNKDECFVYATDKLVSMSVEEGDTMYKGYAKVFDLEKGAFVDGVEIDNGARYALKDLGDAFVVQGKDDSYTMYDASGKEVWHASYADFGTGSLTAEVDGKYCILNTKGETAFATDGYLNTLISTDDLYRLQRDDEKLAINNEGGIVLEGTYDEIQSEYHGLFSVEADDKTKIVNPAGDVLADDVQEFTVSELLPGILTYKNGAGQRCLCLSDGRLIEDVDGLMSDMDFTKDKTHLVFKTGGYDVTLDSPTVLDAGLIRGHVSDGSSTYALYDLFSGEQLLEESYETINWAGGYVYAFKDGSWTVYEAELVNE